MAKAKSKSKRKSEDTPTPREFLDLVVGELRNDMPGIIVGFGDEEEISSRINYRKHPFGIDALDSYLGGGAPEGKTLVMSGRWSSGKSTAAYQLIANYLANNPGFFVLIIDAENTLDETWLVKLGVDISRVIILPGTSAFEPLVDAAIRMVTKAGGKIGMVLLDSVGGIAPLAEIAGKKATRKDEQDYSKVNVASMEDDNVAIVARKIGLYLRKTNVLFSRFRVSSVLITHVYQDISPTGRGGFVPKGGNAMKHFAHVMLKFSRINDQSYKENVLSPDGQVHEVRTGYFTIITIEKTKQSSHEQKVIQVPFKLGQGFDTVTALFHTAVGYGVIDKSGSWYSFEGDNIGQGVSNAVAALQDLTLRTKVRNALNTLMLEDGAFDEDQAPPEPSFSPPETSQGD